MLARFEELESRQAMLVQGVETMKQASLKAGAPEDMFIVGPGVFPTAN